MKKLFFLMTCLIASVTMFAETWEKVEPASIASSDVVVITVTNANGTYAMSNDQGTSKAPTAVPVTVSENKITSTIADNIKWNISNDNGNLTIYPVGQTDTWLYCTSNNNGVRVGTNDAKIFTIDAESGYLKHSGTSRYLGCYNNQDLCCYTTINSNITGQTLAFFKMVSTGEGGGEEGGEETPDTTPVLKADVESIDFGTIEEGGAFAEKTIHVTIANMTGDIETLLESGNSYIFGVAGTLSATGGDLTITVKTKKVGVYSDNLWIFVGKAGGIIIPITAEIKEKFVLPDGAVMDELVYSDIRETVSTSYSDFSGITDNSKDLGVIYAGNMASDKSSIQLRSNNNNSGIVTIASSALAKSITIKWNSGTNAARVLSIYGSNTPYTAATDLYEAATQGTLIEDCAIANGAEQTITIAEDYKYIGIRSKSGALYLDQVNIVWEPLPAVEATDITLDKATAQLDVYHTLQLTATLTPIEATTLITWESSNTEIATVSATGLVTAGGKAGNVTITAKAGTHSATCAVEVLAPAPLKPSEAIALYNTGSYAGTHCIEGYVAEVSEAYSNYGNMSVMLADTKDGEAVIKAFRTVPVDTENLPTLGAKVQVVGELGKYNGTPQIVAGSQLTVLEAGVVVEDKGLVTVAEFLAAKDEINIYTLTGTISNVKNTLYGNFDLTDETGTIYIYGLLDADGNKVYESLGLAEGDTITLKGTYTTYKETPQIASALYISHVEYVPQEKGAITVADFLAAQDNLNIYTLTGVVSNITNTTYGNFDLTDETGSIYIYGLLDLTSTEGQFESLGIEEGDTVTLKGSYSEYNGSAQIASAQYVSHSKYVAPLEFDYNYGVAPAGWKTAQDMYDDLITLLTPYVTVDGTHTIAPLAEVISINGEGSLPWWSKVIDMNVLKDEHFSVQFGWLATYLDATWTAQAAKCQPTAGSANFRYSLSAFFLNTIYTGWPQSPDFTTCGVSSDAWQPYFDFYTAPTREGYDFLGWFDNADANGTPFSFAELPTTGKVYAGWKQNSGTTALENVNGEVNVIKVIENGQVVIIRDGVRYNVLGAKL